MTTEEALQVSARSVRNTSRFGAAEGNWLLRDSRSGPGMTEGAGMEESELLQHVAHDCIHRFNVAPQQPNVDAAVVGISGTVEVGMASEE